MRVVWEKGLSSEYTLIGGTLGCDSGSGGRRFGAAAPGDHHSHHLYQPKQLALIVANPRQPVSRVARERPQPEGPLASARTGAVSLSAVLKVRLVQSACARCVRGIMGRGYSSRFTASTRIPRACHGEVWDLEREGLRKA